MSEVWDQLNGHGSWNLRFARAFDDWELDMVVNLLKTIRKKRLMPSLTKCLGKGEKTIFFKSGKPIKCCC